MCATLGYIIEQLQTDPEFTVEVASVVLNYYFISKSRPNFQQVARSLFTGEPMGPGAQARYPVADDFDAPVFVLPKTGILKDE